MVKLNIIFSHHFCAPREVVINKSYMHTYYSKISLLDDYIIAIDSNGQLAIKLKLTIRNAITILSLNE